METRKSASPIAKAFATPISAEELKMASGAAAKGGGFPGGTYVTVGGGASDTTENSYDPKGVSVGTDTVQS